MLLPLSGVVIFGKGIFEMSENLPNEKTGNTVVVINQASSAVGICALVMAILSIFFLAIPFVPLSLILSIIAIVKKQYAWGICALVTALISAALSPSIWAFFAVNFLLQ